MKANVIKTRSPMMTYMLRVNQISTLLKQLQTACDKDFNLHPTAATADDAADITEVENCLRSVRDFVCKQGQYAKSKASAKETAPAIGTYEDALAIAMAPSKAVTPSYVCKR